jgi:hypothetical protein
VPASGTLVLIGGVGAAFGPVSAAVAMQSFGPGGFFWWLGASHAAIGAFALYRMTRRGGVPRAAQGSYCAVATRVSPVAGALYAEEASEEGRAGGPAPGSRIQTGAEGFERQTGVGEILRHAM